MVELCAGSGTVAKVFRRAGWETITVDADPSCKPDVVADVRSWRCPPADFVWASPPCQQFSLARLRRIEYPDMSVVYACLDRIHESGARWWVVENVRGAVKFFGPPHVSDGRTWFFWGDWPGQIVLSPRPKLCMVGWTAKRGRFLPAGQSVRHVGPKGWATIPEDIAECFQRAVTPYVG
jgi:hypothetical protein